MENYFNPLFLIAAYQLVSLFSKTRMALNKEREKNRGSFQSTYYLWTLL